MRDFSAKERAVAADKAQTDLYFYSRWMFSQRRNYRWWQGPHHPVVARALMDVFYGRVKRLIINEPPRYSKTQQVSDFVSWSLGHVPDAEFIYTSYSGKLATGNSWQTREQVEHPGYREMFPATRLRDDYASKDDWRTTEGGVVYAAGAGGTITGYGAGKMRVGFGGALIIDDPHKADEARSDTIRKGVIDWFQNTLESRLNGPDTPIILIMQRLHEEDLAGWLLNGGNGEKWRHVCLPAIQDDGSALWPEKHSAERLREMQRASPYHFSGQYQQQPSTPEGNIFRPDNMPVIDAIPVGTRMVRGWDFGASDQDGDPTAGVKLGKLPDGRFVIADVRSLMSRPDDVRSAVLHAAQSDGVPVEISIPQDPGQAGKDQTASYVRMLLGFNVHTSPESGDKITRAEPLAAQVNVGNVLMLRAPWNDALTAEMRIFPNSVHDDQVDAASRAFNRLAGAKRSFFG